MDDSNAFSKSFITKMHIAQALERACREKPFKCISTNIIAEKADISRSSFYYHFESKNDVVRWLNNLILAKGLDQIGRTLSWYDGHMVSTTLFDQFPRLFEGAHLDPSYDAGTAHYVRHRISVLSETITEWKCVPLTQKLSFQIKSLANAEVAMGRNSDAEYKSLPIEMYSELMASIVPRELFNLLDSPASPRSFASEHFCL